MFSLVRKLSNEEMVALSRLIELTTQLCLRGVIFVQQLCDAVAILNTATLMAQFLSIRKLKISHKIIKKFVPMFLL